jgi:hypothetical protein
MQYSIRGIDAPGVRVLLRMYGIHTAQICMPPSRVNCTGTPVLPRSCSLASGLHNYSTLGAHRHTLLDLFFQI